MRRRSFLEWLDEATDGPVGHVAKRVVAGFVLLAMFVLGYQAVQNHENVKAHTHQMARDLPRKEKAPPEAGRVFKAFWQ